MRVVIAADHADLARQAAEIAAAVRTAVTARGQATSTVSGGSTPGDLLEALGRQTLPWGRLHLSRSTNASPPSRTATATWSCCDDGCPRVLDVVQLGLGTGGPHRLAGSGDPVLDAVDRDVAVSHPTEPRLPIA